LIHELAALLFELYGFRSNSGSLAMIAAIARPGTVQMEPFNSVERIG
jgi:hypothetical protein